MVLIAKMRHSKVALALFAACFVATLAGFWYTTQICLENASVGWVKRDFESWTPDFTAEALKDQFINPSGITSILLLIGGNLIAKAVAQLSCSFKHVQFTPVLFSYGWVSYVFGLIANAADGAGYFPDNDYSGLVMNLSSGDKRKINSWVIGRLFRDLEKEVDPDGKIADHKTDNDSLRVRLYEFDGSKMSNFGELRPKRDALWWSFVVALFLQIGVAIIPMTPTNGRQEPNFYILLITLAGTLLSLTTGSFLANRSEKYGRIRRGVGGCRDMFALTKGNGYNIVIIIVPNSFDKEARHGSIPSKMPYIADMATASYRPTTGSRIRCFVFGLLWIVLLLLIGGATADSWYLLLVGGIGMVHTIYVAGAKRDSAAHGIPLKELPKQRKIEESGRQMDVLVSLEEEIPGAGYMLRREFFNGPNTIDDNGRWKKFLALDKFALEELVAIADKQMKSSHFDDLSELVNALGDFTGRDLAGLSRESVISAALDKMKHERTERAQTAEEDRAQKAEDMAQKAEVVENLLKGLSTEERMMRLIEARRNTWRRKPHAERFTRSPQSPALMFSVEATVRQMAEGA